MSLTDTSKSNGAWLANTSSSFMFSSSVNVSIKSIMLLELTTTPLGTPVEPEVKFIYTGSISYLKVLVLFSFSSFIRLLKVLLLDICLG